jgi:hypothetical protein
MSDVENYYNNKLIEEWIFNMSSRYEKNLIVQIND